MPGDKSKRAKADWSRLAGGKKCEVAHIVKNIMQDQVRRLIRKLSNDRAKLDATAAKIT
jgi:hypothetical protein